MKTNRKKLNAIRPLLCVAMFMIAAAGTARADVRNLTAENEAATLKRVRELSRMELWAPARGRIKAVPIQLYIFSVYQKMLTEPTRTLDDLRDAFANTLQRIDSQAPDDDPVALSETEFFRAEAVRAYDISGAIAKSKTIAEMYRVMSGALAALDLTPLRRDMALRTWDWTKKYFHGNPPDAIQKSFRAMAEEPLKAETTMDAADASSELAARHAKWLLAVTRGGTP